MSKDKRRLIGSILFLSAVVGLIGFIFQSELAWFLNLFTSPENIRLLVESYEPFGFFILFGLQIIQVIFAPLPGQVVGTAFGTVYGSFWGFILGWFGNIVATIIVIYMVKKYGQPVVEKMAGKEYIERYQNFVEGSDVFPFVVLILLPGIPDDVVCYVAGLSSIDTKRLIIAVSLARAPGIFVLSVFGNSFVEADWTIMIGLIVFVILFTVIVGWKRDEITEYLSENYGRDSNDVVEE